MAKRERVSFGLSGPVTQPTSDVPGGSACAAGGAAAARALFDYGDVFKVGVAFCGNHDATNYSSIWSDKYRGAGTRETWAEQANSHAAHKLQGRLLLIAGDMDDNVHPAHTLTLANALIRAGKEFELMIVPNAGHAVMMVHGYSQRRALDFFVRHLLGREPPQGYELNFEPVEITCFWKKLTCE